MILPSRKAQSVFVLIAALVISVIIAFGRDKSSEVINIASNLVAGDKISLSENSNWQNELEKAGAGAEPIKTESGAVASETVTDAVSRTLVSNYLVLKQNGNLDQTEAQKLIEKSASFIVENTNIETTKIIEKQLNVAADNGKQSIIEYGENLGVIMKTYKPTDPKIVLETVQQIIQTNSSPKIKELEGIIANYNKITEALTKMPVPKTFIKAHLDLVNSIKGGTTALTEVKSISKDPFKGLSVLKTFQDNLITFIQASQAINIYIKQNNVVYKQGSGGYYLLYGI